MPNVPDPAASTGTRGLIGTLSGIFFIALAVLVLATSAPSTRLAAVAVAIVVGGLGLDAIVSTVRRRRSLLSRSGPLP